MAGFVSTASTCPAPARAATTAKNPKPVPTSTIRFTNLRLPVRVPQSETIRSRRHNEKRPQSQAIAGTQQAALAIVPQRQCELAARIRRCRSSPRRRNACRCQSQRGGLLREAQRARQRAPILEQYLSSRSDPRDSVSEEMTFGRGDERRGEEDAAAEADAVASACHKPPTGRRRRPGNPLARPRRAATGLRQTPSRPLRRPQRRIDDGRVTADHDAVAVLDPGMRVETSVCALRDTKDDPGIVPFAAKQTFSGERLWQAAGTRQQARRTANGLRAPLGRQRRPSAATSPDLLHQVSNGRVRQQDAGPVAPRPARTTRGRRRPGQLRSSRSTLRAIRKGDRNQPPRFELSQQTVEPRGGVRGADLGTRRPGRSGSPRPFAASE